MKRGEQGVSLNGGCISNPAIILHETLHALGFLHEHNRPDRDDYVTVYYDNVYDHLIDQFYEYDEAQVDTLNLPYDFNSVMHYDKDAFNKNKDLDTIVPFDPNIPIGGSHALSVLDIKKINALYSCGKLVTYPTA